MKIFYKKIRIDKPFLVVGGMLNILFSFISIGTIGQANSSNSKASSVYTQTFVNTEGLKQSFQNFKGKKVWVVILPDSLKTSDSILLKRIDSVATSRIVSVQTIIIPSIGTNNHISDGGVQLDKFYKSMRSHQVIFSIPSATRQKNRIAQANNIIDWLTNATMNGHFNKELNEFGAIYLIDEKGVLKGALDMNTIWNNQLVNIIFQ